MTSKVAQQIRASIAALPGDIRLQPWDSDYGLVLSSRYGTGGEVVAECMPGRNDSPDDQKEVARHIARMASPHVGEALADVIETWHSADGYSISNKMHEALEALEAAITRERT